MSKLTKEQKMEMVSKAIDAGFNVSLKLHSVNSEKQLDEALSVFGGNFGRIMWGHDNLNKDNQFAGIHINSDNAHEDNFEASIFIDSLRDETS